MNNLFQIKPLGTLLQEAGLISASQLEVAIYDSYCYQEMRIGEILASRGWIKSETADFFAEEWLQMIQQAEKQPLGFYLQEAALLDQKQIQLILQEQPRTLVRLGSLAVIKGWITQKTLDFFLSSLFPSEIDKSPFREEPDRNPSILEETINQKQLSVTQFQRDNAETIVDEIDYEDIPWID